MMMRLFLWLSVLWLAPMVAAMQANEAKFKKNIAVGVTVPREFQSDPALQASLLRFRRGEWAVCAGLVLSGAAAIFVRDFGATFTLWSVWLILLCVLPSVPYARCNQALKRLKVARGWRKAPPARVTQVDLSAIPSYRWLSPWLFALPLAVSLLPLAWNRTAWAVILIDAGCILLFWVCYRFCYRKKSERVDENAALTKVLSQVRLHSWGRLWLVSAWVMAAMNYVYCLTFQSEWLGLVGMILLFALHILVLLRTEFRLRRLQEKLTAGSSTGAIVDEDDLWIWGLFYYNPDDRHVLVNARTGINTGVNLARPAGRAFMAFAALCLIGTLAIGPAFSAAARRPVALTATDTALVSLYGTKEYTVERSAITELHLLDTLPQGLSRANGTSMETLDRGRFFSRDLGGVTVCLDPTVPPFLLVRTDEATYLFGSREPGQAELIYDLLTDGN